MSYVLKIDFCIARIFVVKSLPEDNNVGNKNTNVFENILCGTLTCTLSILQVINI